MPRDVSLSDSKCWNLVAKLVAVLWLPKQQQNSAPPAAEIWVAAVAVVATRDQMPPNVVVSLLWCHLWWRRGRYGEIKIEHISII